MPHNCDAQKSFSVLRQYDTLWQSLGANNFTVFINVLAYGYIELGWPQATPVSFVKSLTGHNLLKIPYYFVKHLKILSPY